MCVQRSRSSAFTLVELLVVIGIIALLVSILLPSLAAAREQGQSIKCLSNLRQLSLAFANYSADTKGFQCPPDIHNTAGASGSISDYWSTILVSMHYLKYPPATSAGPPGEDNVFRCPSGNLEFRSGITGNTIPSSRQDENGAMGQLQQSSSLGMQPGLIVYNWYGFNATSTGYKWSPFRRVGSDNTSASSTQDVVRIPDKTSRVRKATDIVMLFDGVFLNLQTVNANRLNARHNKKKFTNCLFADGHAESLRTKDLPGGDQDANNSPGGGATVTFGLANLRNYAYPKWRLDQ
jgi:prepilin-type processing-associated H-X9-DG protein/prepilin-type N-terminal cleavage/methylation domain-containing protein